MRIYLFLVLLAFSSTVFAQSKTGTGPDIFDEEEESFVLLKEAAAQVKNFRTHHKEQSKKCANQDYAYLWDDEDIMSTYFKIKLITFTSPEGCKKMSNYLKCLKTPHSQELAQKIIDNLYSLNYFKKFDKSLTKKDQKKAMEFFRDSKLDCNPIGIGCGM